MSFSKSVIILDDDYGSLKLVSAQLAPKYKLLPSGDFKTALRWLETERSVTMLVVNQNYRRTPWTQVMEEAQKLRPDVRRVLQSSYNDLSGIVPSLHNGFVNQIVSKPISSGEIQTL